MHSEAVLRQDSKTMTQMLGSIQEWWRRWWPWWPWPWP